MEPILSVNNLTKVFVSEDKTEYTAVSEVSFDVNKGETLGLIGESGSGKTTVVNMITRLTDITSGTVSLGGTDITKLKGKALAPFYRKMQMVFQTPVESFDPRKTLGYGISESLRNAGVSKKEAEEKAKKYLVKCGLTEEFYKKYPHEVSGGQCQRAAIARALVIEPELLILDEATSSLDVTIQKEVLALLSELKMELNLSMLFICHDIALIQQFADRVLVMYKGRIVEEGVPDEVIKNPKDAYTKRLIDSIL